MIDWDEIVDIDFVGEEDCYDITLLENDVYIGEPNFIADGIVVHNCKMQERYIERKKGREKYTLHPLLKPILDTTYGVITFQEQTMKVLNVVGEIPLKDCELVRKAISKKKVEGFIKYKEMFILNGQKNLSCSEEEINHLFDQLLSWSEYGFNKCLTGDTLVRNTITNDLITLEEAENSDMPIDLLSFIDGEMIEDNVESVFKTGNKEAFEIMLDNEMIVRCTLDHKFICSDYEFHTIEGILEKKLEILWGEDKENLLKKCSILSVKSLGFQPTYNVTMKSSQHNYAVLGSENKGKYIVSRNSHAVAYTYISAYLLYLKSHYPHEFYAATLSCETVTEKIKEYKMEAKLHGVEVKRLDINRSKINFDLQGDFIYFGFSNIKGIGEGPAKRIVEGQPYKSFEDFLTRFGTDTSVLKPLLGLRCFKDRDPITLWKFSEYFKDQLKKLEGKKKRYEAAMIKYDEEFKELLPYEIRTLSELENGKENPFDSEGWKLQLDKNEEIEVNKEVLCSKDDPGAKERVVVEDIEVEGTGLYLQRETIKYYHSGKVKKVWNLWKELKKLWQRRSKSIERSHNIEKENLPSLLGFDANSRGIDDVLMKELRDSSICEEKYLGFSWIHDLELSPDYAGNRTFADLKNDIRGVSGPVEMRIKKISKTKSKQPGSNFVYYQVIAEDATGQENRINVWPDDWEWWHREFGWEETGDKSNFTPGNLLRVRLQPPTGGFNTFTLESNQVGKWRNQKRFNNKSDDIRVVVMAKGQKEEEKFLTDEEAMDQFTNCIMEK